MTKTSASLSPTPSPAQIERLAILAEEIGEAIDVVFESMLAGLSHNRTTDNILENLNQEIGDVHAALTLLEQSGDIAPDSRPTGIGVHREDHAERRLPWLGHSLAQMLKIVGKSLRFGLDNRYPDVADAPTNREALADLDAAFRQTAKLLHTEPGALLSGPLIAEAEAAKLVKLRRYTRHQDFSIGKASS